MTHKNTPSTGLHQCPESKRHYFFFGNKKLRYVATLLELKDIIQEALKGADPKQSSPATLARVIGRACGAHDTPLTGVHIPLPLHRHLYAGGLLVVPKTADNLLLRPRLGSLETALAKFWVHHRNMPERLAIHTCLELVGVASNCLNQYRPQYLPHSQYRSGAVAP